MYFGRENKKQSESEQSTREITSQSCDLMERVGEGVCLGLSITWNVNFWKLSRSCATLTQMNEIISPCSYIISSHNHVINFISITAPHSLIRDWRWVNVQQPNRRPLTAVTTVTVWGRLRQSQWDHWVHFHHDRHHNDNWEASEKCCVITALLLGYFECWI